jgi:hypothetical protein
MEFRNWKVGTRLGIGFGVMVAPGVRLVVASLELSRNKSGAGKEAK